MTLDTSNMCETSLLDKDKILSLRVLEGCRNIFFNSVSSTTFEGHLVTVETIFFEGFYYLFRGF
jgi:hypothetical protein